MIIPTLNAAGTLPATLAALGSQTLREIVLADGGSIDATAALANSVGAMVIAAKRGRGTQLAAGAGAAAGEWLLFLHADCRLERGGRRRWPLSSGSRRQSAAPAISTLRSTTWRRRRGGWSGSSPGAAGSCPCLMATRAC